MYVLLTTMFPVALRFNAPVDRIVVAVPTMVLVLTLPPVTLPLALTEPADIAADVIMLPPVTFALTETVEPVNAVAFTLAPPNTLPPVMLPVTLTVVPV